MAMPQAFVKVGQIFSGMNGHTLLTKVLTPKTVHRKCRAVQAARKTRIECLVTDETGCVIFVAPNNRVGMLKTENIRTLHNADIVMSKGIMMLVVDKRGVVEVTGPEISDITEDNNLPQVSYELVCIED